MVKRRRIGASAGLGWLSSRGSLTGPLLAAVCAAGALACDEREPPDEAMVRDSAGVQIIEYGPRVWEVSAGWTVGTEPMLELGAADSAPEYEFAGIEGAIRLPDGRIVVADGGSREIRIYGADGGFVATTGGRGEAPGEFRLIDNIGFGPGDSIWVYDFGLRRFTVLTDSGRVVRTMALGPELSNVGGVGRLADGSFVVREYWSSRGDAAEIGGGLSRELGAVARYSPDGARLDTIGLFPGREVFIGSEEGRAVMAAPLFARSLSVAVSDDRIVIGDPVTFEFGLYTPGGELLRLVRIRDVDLRVRPEDVEAEIEARLAAEPSDRRPLMRAHLEAMDVPGTHPAYGRLLADREGHVWLADYTSSTAEPREWRVFDHEGQLVGRVTLPGRFRALDIGAEWIVGVWRDEQDVETIRVYRILKG